MSTATTYDPAIEYAMLLEAEEAERNARPQALYAAGRQDWPHDRRYQLNFHRSQHVIRAIFIGNGGGKSSCAAVEADYWLQHNHPYQDTPKWPVQVIWMCLKFQQMDMLCSQLEQNCLTGGWKWNQTDHCYIWPGGDTLTLFSNDGDWSGIQGIPADLVIIDEECDSKFWMEFKMRRRVSKKTRFVITATATKGKRWMFSDVYKQWLDFHAKKGIGEDAAMIQQKHPRIWCWPKGGIEDNPGSSAEDVNWYADALMMATDAERQVRRHGGFQDFNAAPVFNLAALDEMEKKNEEEGVTPIEGWFTVEAHPKDSDESHGVVFTPGLQGVGNGWLRIYEPPTDDYYGLGSDHGYGLVSGDDDAIVVMRQRDAKQVAAACGRWGDAEMAWLMWKLAEYYHDALIVGERQVGLVSLRRIYDEYGYTRIWFNKDETYAAARPSDLLGHHRMAGDLLIPRLALAVAPVHPKTGKREPSQCWLTDPETIKQCREFEWRPRSSTVEIANARTSQLKQSAPSGAKDDMVLATGYAYMAVCELPKFPPAQRVIRHGSAAHILGHAKEKDRPTDDYR